MTFSKLTGMLSVVAATSIMALSPAFAQSDNETMVKETTVATNNADCGNSTDCHAKKAVKVKHTCKCKSKPKKCKTCKD